MAKKKRRRRRPALYTPVAVLLVLFLIVFGISVFFRINRIEVTGNLRYGAEEIIAASGIAKGDNLMLLDHGAAALQICGKMPYISDVRVVRRLPDLIVLEVAESVPLAFVSVEGERYIIDKNARVLEKTDASGTAGLVQVKGLLPLQPEVGKSLSAGDAGQPSLIALTKVLAAMEVTGVYEKTKSLDVENIGKVTFEYDGIYTVDLGSSDEAEEKLAAVLSTISQQTTDTPSTIKFTSDGKIRVIPK